MIWFRRILAILLAILFIILLPLLFFISEVNDTVADPDFYNSQMEKADIYNFLYDEALPAALEEAEEEHESDVPVDFDDIETEIVTTARKSAPPQWLKSNFEAATSQIVPYLRGSTDEFSYTIDFKDKVQASPRIVKEEILHSESFENIYDDLISYAAEKTAENLDRVPYPLALSQAEIEDSLRKVIDKAWLAERIEEAMNSTIPYLTREKEHFTITVPLKDRVDAIAEATLDLLSRQETYDYVVEEIIAPIVIKELAPEVELPFSVTLTRQEVIEGIKDSLPPSWFKAQLGAVIYSITGYVKGEKGSTDIVVDLTDRKPAIEGTLIEIGDEKLEAIFQRLPVCSVTEFEIARGSTPPDSLPYCRPAGVSYEQYKSILGIELSGEIDSRILDVIPDQWTYTQNDLVQSMGAENENFLEEARDNVADGWTFTDADLKDELDDPEKEADLEEIRDWLDNGYTLTQEDIEDELDEEELVDFNDARSQIDSFRSLLWIMWLIPILLLVAIGFMGGRNWKGRSLWALSVMLIASVIVLIATSVIYSNVVKPEVEEAFDLSEYDGLELVMAEKANEMLENAASDFASGIQTDALFMVIFAGVVLVAVVGWSIYQRRAEHQLEGA
ncbi:MAG: hypothetical protein R6U37_10075 [Dehalococcoidia bacterium]